MNTYDEAIETLKDLKESYIAVKEDYNSLQFELSYIKEALRILKIEDKRLETKTAMDATS